MMRCSKCLMPSSLPDSNFNQFNECSWCQSKFPNYVPRGAEELREILEKNRTKSGSADCLIGLSGGKDSSYVLMELQETFGMRVEAFTYFHDGLMPFALENAKNVCKNLGVKHHIVSLPDHIHLESFKTFFSAWVRSARLVTAALTCVACKHLHILGAEVAVKRGIPMMVSAVCSFELPPFLALRKLSKEHFDREGVLKGAMLLARETGLSIELCKGIIRHLSTCLYGCLAFSPTSKYLRLKYPTIKHVFFFDYCEWNPSDIVEKLTTNVGWKKPENVVDDWHSDCVFNVFKEYMFQKMFGASYMDAFLSNQIRYGIISRDEAWDILVRSKEYFANELMKALDFVGLKHLAEEMDISCFHIMNSN